MLFRLSIPTLFLPSGLTLPSVPFTRTARRSSITLLKLRTSLIQRCRACNRAAPRTSRSSGRSRCVWASSRTRCWRWYPLQVASSMPAASILANVFGKRTSRQLYAACIIHFSFSFSCCRTRCILCVHYRLNCWKICEHTCMLHASWGNPPNLHTCCSSFRPPRSVHTLTATTNLAGALRSCPGLTAPASACFPNPHPALPCLEAGSRRCFTWPKEEVAPKCGWG